MTLFRDKVVLISGTGGREGAKILGCDIAAGASTETTRLVQAAGGEMISLEPVDLAEPGDAERWVAEALDRWGRVDVLYNNAAGLSFAPMDDATLDHWDYTIRNELTIAFAASRAIWPHFVRQRRGVIVSVASIAGHRELTGFPCVAHGVANAGIQALARMLAAAGAPHGIRSVSISPGIIASPASTTPPPFAVPVEPLWASAALGRPGTAEEVIETALFLASDKASYITGTDVAVDGGMSGIIWRR